MLAMNTTGLFVNLVYKQHVKHFFLFALLHLQYLHNTSTTTPLENTSARIFSIIYDCVGGLAREDSKTKISANPVAVSFVSVVELVLNIVMFMKVVRLGGNLTEVSSPQLSRIPVFT